MKKNTITIAQLFLSFLLFTTALHAQEYFRVEIEETNFPNSPALHSAAFAKFNNKWIIIGGRTNGLHGFNAIDPFTSNGNNANIYLVNPDDETTLSLATTTLPLEIRESIIVSNMQFSQIDSTLYIVGGYGWNDSAQQFLTSRALVAVNLSLLTQAIENQSSSYTHCFRIIKDERLAVCGAHIKNLNNTFYLVFGHLFDGTYARVNNGLFVQQYTRAIRKFNIDDDGTNLAIANYGEIYDSLNFRRRDYNLVNQIFPDGRLGFTAFTGVFQEGINLPYLNTVDIAENGYQVINNFNQNLSQYHNAVMPIYDSASNYMHTVFFGGIAQYYRDTITNALVNDSLVPFVNTISMISRDSLGNLTEYELPIKFPALLGTNAEFITANNISLLHENIININSLGNRTLVGYIMGGIESPEANISITDPSNSFASSRIFKVFINKQPEDSTITKNAFLVKEPTILKIQPNPFDKEISIVLNNNNTKSITLKLFSGNNKLLKEVYSGKEPKKVITINTEAYAKGLYYLELRTENFRKIYRVIKQ